MLRGNKKTGSGHVIRKGLALFLSLSMFLSGIPTGNLGDFGTGGFANVYADEAVASSSNAALIDGELENDLLSGESIVLPEKLYSDTMYEDQIVFTGIDSKVFVAGEEIDLMEGVGARIPGYDYRVTVRVVELSDSNGNHYPNRTKFLVPETENVTYKVKYMAYIKKDELQRLGNVVIATQSNAGSMLRRSSAPVATSAGLPVGGIIHLAAVTIGTGTERLQVDNIRTGSEFSYTDQTISAKVSVDATVSSVDIPGAYALLRVPTKHLDTRVLNASTGEVAGLRINDSSLINNNTIRFTREVINGEEFIVAKIFFNDLKRTTAGDFPYNIKFADDRLTPSDYVLQTEVEFYNGNDQSIGISPKADFKPLYDAQKITKYAMSNSNESYSTDNQLLYGGPTVNNVIQEATAINVPFVFNMQTKDTTSSYSRANGIYRQRLIEKIVLEDTLPTYTNQLTGETNFPAVFDPAANPGWTVSETDAAGRPTKVRMEVSSVSNDRLTGGADAVLKESVVLNLKFPGLHTNQKTVSGLRVSSDQTNNISAKLIPYGATAGELADPALTISDHLTFNLQPNESGAGMIGKRNVEANISIENGFMHTDAKGANFIVNFYNKRSVPTTTFSLYDFKADPRTYYKEIEFRSNEGDVGGDKVVEIWGIDANKNRIGLIYSRATGPALPAATGVDPNASNVSSVKLPLDAAVTNQVAQMVADVQSGAILDTDTIPVPRTYEGIEVVYDSPIPAYASASFRIHLGFRDPYHVRVDNPDNLIENSAAFKAGYTVNGTNTTLEGEVQRNLTRLIPLQESIEFTKATLANDTGDLNTQPLYRISLFFTKMSNSRVLRNVKIIDLLPYGMEFVRTENPIRTNVTNIEQIPNYMDTGRTALIFTLDDIVVDGFPVDNINRKWIQISVRCKIVKGMFPDTNGNLDANRNYSYFMADGLYPLGSSVTVPTITTPNAAGQTYGLTDDIYDIDNNPRTTKVLGASSKTKVNVGGQVVSYKQIRNKNGKWVPNGNSSMGALDGIVTRFDEEFEYRIVTENKTTGAYAGYAVYDILPYVGDQAYGGTTDSRNSAFRNRLQGPIEAAAGTDAQDFVIMYSTNPNPNPDSVAAMTDPAMDWKTQTQISDWEAVTAFKINLAPGKVLKNGLVVRFAVPMKAPVLPTDSTEAGRLYLSKALNLFQASYNYDTVNRSFASSNTVFNHLGRNVSVKKVWSGTDPQIPITVQLKQNGQNFSSDLYPDGRITLNPADNYEGVFERIPPSDGNGNRYTYTLEEVGIGTGALANYSAAITGDDEAGFIVRNIEKRDLTVKKIWQDAGYEQLARPQNIQIQLKRSTSGATAVDVGSPVTMTGTSDTWEHTFTALPVSDDQGNRYTYSVEELQSPALRNYAAPVIADVSETEKTITNTLALRDLTVRKIWRDDAGLGTRPNALTVKVFRGTTQVDQAVLGGSSDTWTHTFRNLLKYDSAGNEIAYTLQEEAVGLNNYLQTPAVTEADKSMTLVNTFVPFAVRAVVNWVDDNNSLQTRPNGVKITLQRSVDGGATFEDVPGEADRELNVQNGFTHDYQNVAKYSPNNVEYVYRIVQSDHVNLKNYPNDAAHRVYTSDTSGNVKEFKVTNIYHTKVVQGSKLWVELGSAFTRPNSLEIQLFRNNQTASAFRSKTITSLDVDPLNPNRWIYTFDHLPVYDQNGDAYSYSVAEEQVPAFYMAVVNGFEITNTYPRDTQIKVKKIWDHGALPQRFHPTSATFELLRDNAVFDSITLHAANASVHNWEHTFLIGESNARGHSFTVREVDVPNYTAEYANTGTNETTITNTYSPVPVEVRLSGRKDVTGKYIPEEELYTFVLEPVNGALMPDNRTGAMEIRSLKGAFDFGAIRYTYPGEFQYRIYEVNTGSDGFTYDASVYDVTVNVTQQIQGLAADVRYSKNGSNATSAEFHNTYIPPLGNLVFWNRVRGRNTMWNNDYTLKITFEDEGVFEYNGARSGSFSKEMTITLKRNQRVTIKDIPVGMKYSVALVTANGQFTENPVNEGKIVKGLNQVEVIHYEIRDRSSRVVGSGGSKLREGGPGTKLSPIAMDDKFLNSEATNEQRVSTPSSAVNIVKIVESRTNSDRVVRNIGRLIPRTGDSARLLFFTGILALAVGGFAFVGLRKKKEKQEEE